MQIRKGAPSLACLLSLTTVLIVAGGFLDGILSSLAPCAGPIQHSHRRILWLLFSDCLWVSVSCGLKEGSCPYPSEFFLEEQAWWAWESFILSLDSFVMLLSASPTSKIHFLCETCLFCWRFGEWSVPCCFISFSHFHGVKASHPSECLRFLSYWPYSRHLITFLFILPKISLDLALLFSSGHWSQWAHHSYFLAMACVSPFVWMPSTASTNSVESLLFFKAHFKVPTL